MNKIALVIPFYGKLPPYFGLYLKSLKAIHIDVLFVTDLEVKIPPEITNFTVVNMTFAELQQHIRNVLDPNAVLLSTRKLCDYRPFYGKLFEKQLDGYAYWAHGDCDLIYGKKFNDILDEIVSGQYDVASMRKNWMSGSFSVFKNNERMRNLYTSLENWREVCALGKNVCYDECVAIHFEELASGTMTVMDCYREAGDSLSALVWRSSELKFFHRDIMCEDSLSHHIVKMNRGRLYLNGTEIPVFHYIGLKYRRYFSYTDIPYAEVPDVFWIDDTGFYFSRGMRIIRPIVRFFKKLRALMISLRVNGVSHWIKRIFPVFYKV